MNPIKYTSTDFWSVMNDINSDPELVDTPEFWKRIWAGARDGSSVYENAIANNSFLRTSFTRQATADWLALIAYDLTPYSTSSGTIVFHLDPAVTFPLTFTADELKAQSQGSISTSSKSFESRTSATVTAVSAAFTASAATSRLTVTRVYTTGEKVRVSTTGTLPGGLAASTDYYAIYYDNTHIYLALTQAYAFAGLNVTIADAGTGVHTISLYSFSVSCYQQDTTISSSTPSVVGTSDGSTEWQEFQLPDTLVLADTLAVTINSVPWTKVDSFVNSISTDKHFKLIYLDDQKCKIQFGNGTYGAVPGNFAVYVSYATGGGANSNLYTLNSIISYSGGRTEIVGCTNAVQFTGGADEQDIASAKILGPMLLQASNLNVTTANGESLAQAYPGVMKSVVNKNIYGLLSEQVIIIPSGGGLPSSALKSALQTYLIDRSVLESIDVRVVDPQYDSQSPVLGVHILSGYTWATVQGYVVLALRLFFSECATEILSTYESEGIASAVAYINLKWSTSFTASDYEAITRMLDNLTPSEFGQTYQESQVQGFLNEFVNGVDYVIISSPSFPLIIAYDHITTDAVSSSDITQIP